MTTHCTLVFIHSIFTFLNLCFVRTFFSETQMIQFCDNMLRICMSLATKLGHAPVRGRHSTVISRQVVCIDMSSSGYAILRSSGSRIICIYCRYPLLFKVQTCLRHLLRLPTDPLPRMLTRISLFTLRNILYHISIPLPPEPLNHETYLVLQSLAQIRRSRRKLKRIDLISFSCRLFRNSWVIPTEALI